MAVFIDKDGTLVEDIPYNVKPGLIRFNPGAGMGLKKLKDHGFLLVLISNQSGVARGYFRESALEAVKQRIQELLQESGCQMDAFYFCPHHPDGVVTKYAISCPCRKPEPGMLLKAAKDLDIDLARSWMIGDILNDVEAGNSAGCKTILIDNGNETEWHRSEKRKPTATAAGISDAAEIILHEPAWA